jgi:hypothetical protein
MAGQQKEVLLLLMKLVGWDQAAVEGVGVLLMLMGG